MVGNSSSGIIESSSFRLPVVNIGDRQRGRIKPANVIDVKDPKKHLILKAIYKATSSEFRNSLNGLKNPYGDGGASEKIVAVLKKIDLGEKIIKKRFYELKSSNH